MLSLTNVRLYDNGNLTNWVTDTVNWAYQWDWADRLTKVTSNNVVVLQNWYDANGRRIAKQEGTSKLLYLYDGWNIVEVMNENGQLLESYTRGVGLAGDIGTLLAMTHHATSPMTPGTYYVHCNHRGDIVLTRSGTTTVGAYTYLAFGTLQSTIGQDVCRFKFSSKERDASTGFSYYGYRFYASQWQRWLSRDPLNESGFQLLHQAGWDIASPSDNLYTYCYNDPVNSADPFGTKREWGGLKFPLDWFDTSCPRNCGVEAAECAMRGLIVCGVAEKGLGKYGYRLCMLAYGTACKKQYDYCMQWNKEHGF